MPDFSRVITLAYTRILGRPPDPEGLENYNRLMNVGMTEAQMRESLLRSPEYEQKNPTRDLPVSTTAGRSASGSRSRRKKKTRG